MVAPKKKKSGPSDNTLIKAALRRAFARSSIHRELIEAIIITGHSDPKRKQVKTWCKPPCCGVLEAKSYIQIDHIEPVQPLGVHIDEMTKEEILARIWCDRNNLVPICKACHQVKSKAENAERRRIRKEKGLVKSRSSVTIKRTTKE